MAISNAKSLRTLRRIFLFFVSTVKWAKKFF